MHRPGLGQGGNVTRTSLWAQWKELPNASSRHRVGEGSEEPPASGGARDEGKFPFPPETLQLNGCEWSLGGACGWGAVEQAPPCHQRMADWPPPWAAQLQAARSAAMPAPTMAEFSSHDRVASPAHLPRPPGSWANQQPAFFQISARMSSF